MQSLFRCGEALGLVLFFGLVCSPFQPVYPASPTSESSAMAPDQAMDEKILQHIQYGTPIQAEGDAKAAVAEKASDSGSAKADVSDYPPEYGTGEIHVKLRRGWKLDRADHVTRITKEGQIQYPDELLYLDYEFPESSIEPLWGPAGPLLELKARGEKLSGQSLPDLSLWYSIKPDPTLSSVKTIGTEEVADYRLPSFIVEATRRAIDILRTMPGVESVRVAAPMVRSSWPSIYANTNPNWVPFQLQTAPDAYDTSGDADYGEYNNSLAISDLTAGLRVPAQNGDYDLYAYPPLRSDDETGKYLVGGLNIWPAWQAQFKGEGVAIGYVEEDWCLKPIPDGDPDPESACSTHPDLQALRNGNHLKYLTSERINYMFGFSHGTSVLGIMAADHNSSGTMGITPNADYYIGQAWYTWEWITIVQKIIQNNQGNGALFMAPPFGCFNSDPDRMAACPVEVHPEYMQFIRTLTANNFVVVTIPGNGYFGIYAGVNLDNPIDVDGDSEGGEFDYASDNVVDAVEGVDGYEGFDYTDASLDYDAFESGNNGYQTLDRGSSSFVDSGSILVAAGTAQDWKNPKYYTDTDALLFSRRSRELFASYGSRVDVQARGSANVSPITVTEGSPLYGLFPATSSCWPQVTASAALVQQMYKTLPLKTSGQAGDFLTSIRMRNALVENGNPQIPMDVDPHWVHFAKELENHDYFHDFRANSYFGLGGGVPSFLESPAEPFARIGPRPDLGNVMYAFGLLDVAGNYTAYPISRYKLAFENHQYSTVSRVFCFGSPPFRFCSSHTIPLFIPNEPFSRNYIFPAYFNTTDWSATLVRSPRIAGGFALKLEGTTSNDRSTGKYLRVYDSTGFDSSYLHANGIGAYDQAAFTLSAWINITQQTSNNQYIFYKQTSASSSPQIVEYGMYIDAGMHLCFDHTLDGTTTKLTTCTSSMLTTNRVYHVAIVLSTISGQIAIMPYINGVKTRTSPALFSGTTLRYVDPLPEIGLGFSGYIDEIVFEKEVFPQTCDIYCYRNPTLEKRFLSGANPSGLIASWGFDKKDAMIIDDPVSGYRGSLYAPDGDLDVDLIEADMPIYNQWGANVPIADFAASSNGLTVADPANSNYPPGSLANLGSQFSIEAFFKMPDSQTSNSYRLLARKTIGGEVSYEIVCQEQKDDSYHKYRFTISVFNQNGQQISATSDEIEVYPAGDVGVVFPVLDKSWAHLLITYDGSTTKQIKMYLNSKPLNAPMSQNPSVWGAPKSVASPLIIGKSLYSSDLKWPSEMAFVRFYSSVLTQDNAKFLYRNRSSLWQNSYYRTVVTP